MDDPLGAHSNLKTKPRTGVVLILLLMDDPLGEPLTRVTDNQWVRRDPVTNIHLLLELFNTFWL